MKQVINLIQNHSKRPLLVAIEGHSAAGKSTLAKRISESMGSAIIIPTDDFYRVMSEEERFRLNPEEGYACYYDWQRLRGVLETLTTGQIAKYRRYDWSANKLGENVRINPQGLVIVEGCYSLRPELTPFYHLSFFVETPSTLRMERQRQRGDACAAWMARWHAAESYHFLKNAPEEAADLIVNEVAA